MARGRKHKVGKKKGHKSKVRLEPTLKHMSMHKGGHKKSRRKKA